MSSSVTVCGDFSEGRPPPRDPPRSHVFQWVHHSCVFATRAAPPRNGAKGSAPQDGRPDSHTGDAVGRQHKFHIASRVCTPVPTSPFPVSFFFDRSVSNPTQIIFQSFVTCHINPRHQAVVNFVQPFFRVFFAVISSSFGTCFPLRRHLLSQEAGHRCTKHVSKIC